MAGQGSRPRVVGGRWELGEAIGSGGFGTVFRGRHVTTDQEAAIKVLHHRGDPATAARFAQEVRVPVKLGNPPGIATVYDAGADDDGSLYVAMELLSGFTLAERMAHVDALEILELILDMLGALAIAHDRGFVHRDLKPDNVFVLRRPDRGVRSKLLDFGIAKWLGNAPATRSQQVIGTPHYMSPEQIRGETPTPASDVWSVGVILYESLTGTRPFDGPNPIAIIARVTEGQYAPILSGRAWIPAGLADLVARCLRRSPNERPSDARELRQALDSILSTRDAETALAGRRASTTPQTGSVAPPAEQLSPAAQQAPAALRSVPPTVPLGEAETARAALSYRPRDEVLTELPPTSHTLAGGHGRRLLVAAVALATLAVVIPVVILVWPESDRSIVRADLGHGNGKTERDSTKEARWENLRTESSTLMPEPLSGAVLGMTLVELLEVRPGVGSPTPRGSLRRLTRWRENLPTGWVADYEIETISSRVTRVVITGVLSSEAASAHLRRTRERHGVSTTRWLCRRTPSGSATHATGDVWRRTFSSRIEIIAQLGDRERAVVRAEITDNDGLEESQRAMDCVVVEDDEPSDG